MPYRDIFNSAPTTHPYEVHGTYKADLGSFSDFFRLLQKLEKERKQKEKDHLNMPEEMFHVEVDKE